MTSPRDEQHVEIMIAGIESTSRLLGLPPTYNGKPVITKELATECLAVVKGLLGTGGEDARLYPPGHEGPYWCVSLEGHEYDWPYRLSQIDGAFPVGVWTEAVNGFALALHPA